MGFCFLAAGISAYLVLKNNGAQVARKTLRLALVFGLVASLMALFPTGHHHARQVARTQPEKFAAMEGLTHGQTRASLTVFGIPSEEPPRLNLKVGIPGMLSLMAFGDVDAHVPGLEDLREEGWPTPPFVITFLSFHTMVGLGTFFIALTAFGVLLLYRRKLFETRWYLKSVGLWPRSAANPGWSIACSRRKRPIPRT